MQEGTCKQGDEFAIELHRMNKVVGSNDEITKNDIDVDLLDIKDRFKNEKPNTAQLELAVILLKTILNRFKLDEIEKRLFREILNQVTYF